MKDIELGIAIYTMLSEGARQVRPLCPVTYAGVEKTLAGVKRERK